MTRRGLAVALVMAVVLAGCLGGPAETPANDSTPTADVTGDDVPGVTNGTLTNVSALAEANAASLTDAGGDLQVALTGDGQTTEYRLQLSAGASTYLLNGTSQSGADGPQTVALWANETSTVVRFGTGDDARYRVAARQHEIPTPLRTLESALAGGQFSVANASTGNGTVVLTADAYTAPERGEGRFENVSEYDATLVVDETGRIHALTVTAVAEGDEVTYSYELRANALEDVARPAWLDDVPASASLRADIGLDVENESVLTLTHRAGDTVPADSTLTLETNGTTLETTVPTQLAAGDTVYAYRHASNGTLAVSVDRPAPDAVRSLESPLSVTLTADGTTILSAGMGWESAGASDGEGSSSSAGGSSGS